MNRRARRIRNLRDFGGKVTKSAVSGAGAAGARGRGLVKAGSAAVRHRTGGWVAWLIASGWLLLVWFALWGSISPMLALTGLAATAVTLLVFPLPVVEFGFGLHPWRAFVLVMRFLGDVVVASIQVAWLAVRPGAGPRGAITTVQLRSTSDLVQTLTALAVSLVPGSLIVEADPENRTLVIHVLDVPTGGMGEFHRRVLDQEERILRALGSAHEIEAVMGGEDEGGLAVHSGSVSLGSTVMLDRDGRPAQGSALFADAAAPEATDAGGSDDLDPAEARDRGAEEPVPHPSSRTAPVHREDGIDSTDGPDGDDERKAGERP